MEKKRIELCVPADKSMRLIVRMTTSGVVSCAGFTLDEMDDIKMAIDEACNLMMLQKPGCKSLKFVYECSEEAVTALVEGQEFADEETEENADMNMQEVIRCILESMVDEAVLTENASGQIKAIRLKKNVPSDRRSAL